jgi:hypothetical protein
MNFIIHNKIVQHVKSVFSCHVCRQRSSEQNFVMYFWISESIAQYVGKLIKLSERHWP